MFFSFLYFFINFHIADHQVTISAFSHYDEERIKRNFFNDIALEKFMDIFISNFRKWNVNRMSKLSGTTSCGKSIFPRGDNEAVTYKCIFQFTI
jgi:hypothetical protein